MASQPEVAKPEEAPIELCAVTRVPPTSAVTGTTSKQTSNANKEESQQLLKPNWSCLGATSRSVGSSSHPCLFGRQEETNRLKDAFDRCWQDVGKASSELVLLSGPSGSGKSALARSVLQPLAFDNDGYYVVGKFDQLHQNNVHIRHEPYSPFVQAITELVVLWENNEENHTNILGEALQEQMDPDHSAVLQALIPALSRIFQSTASSASNASNNTTLSSLTYLPASTTAMGRIAQQDRLFSAMRDFFHIVCAVQQHPFVLVLDDCQWSDSGSLALLDSLLTTPL